MSNPPPDFLIFWSEYPRKIGKLAAMRSYAHALRNASPDEIISGVKRYKSHIAIEGIEDRYVVHPTTFLNHGRWLDEYLEPCTHAEAEEIKWRGAVRLWKANGHWPDIYGPKPGQPGCKCPREFLVEEAAA